MKSLFLSGFVSFAACTAALATTVQPDDRTIPERFHGEWNSVLADCGTANNDSMVTITGDRIDFYESTGEVRGAFMDSPDDALIVVTTTGEEETSTIAIRYSIAPDASSLTEYSESEEPFVRYRCPRT